MIKVYDKAKWHIEAGEDKNDVLERFAIMYSFLKNKHLLSNEGLDIIKSGVDSSISLDEYTVNEEGKKFLNNCYDIVVELNEKELVTKLNKLYNDFVK